MSEGKAPDQGDGRAVHTSGCIAFIPLRPLGNKKTKKMHRLVRRKDHPLQTPPGARPPRGPCSDVPNTWRLPR